MFPDMKTRSYEYLSSSRLSSPTCEDLGIPREEVPQTAKCIRNVSLQTERLRHEAVSKRDPFSPLSIIPVPGQFGFGILETSFIRKRNERERDRVRCVNEGYNKLKQHLPLRNKEKRISKVETLRTAIDYIKHLQAILEQNTDQKTSFERNFSQGQSESMDDSETDISDTEQKLDIQDSLCSSDDETFS